MYTGIFLTFIFLIELCLIVTTKMLCLKILVKNM